MKTEHYFCDQCKKEVEMEDKKPKLIKLTVGVGSPFYNSYGYNRFEIHKEIEVCFECASKVGFVMKEKEIAKTPDIQERLYEIMCEIVQNNLPND